MYLVFNMAVLPFRVLSDNHKIHIFMSKITRRKTFVDQLMIQSQKLQPVAKVLETLYRILA